MTEVELSRALLLTYAGVGAAFVVLGSLIVYTLLLGGLGNWRARRQEIRMQQAAAENPPTVAAKGSVATATAAAPEKPPAAPPDLSPQIAAAIATAVALAQEIQRREQAEQAADREPAIPAPAEGNGWREQGRMAAFDTRRLRERER